MSWPIGEFKTFTVVAPTDSRLGDASETSGLLYSANPSVSALTNNVTMLATPAAGIRRSTTVCSST
jgi:hypothetical protein